MSIKDLRNFDDDSVEQHNWNNPKFGATDIGRPKGLVKATDLLVHWARMGLETLIVHAVRPQVREDRIRYSQSLCSDSEALQEPCTARTICYTPIMAAAVICNLVKRYVNNEAVPGQIILDLATYSLIV